MRRAAEEMREADQEVVDSQNRLRRSERFFEFEQKETANHMKEYFKKSNIYKKYVQEQADEKVEDRHFLANARSLSDMRQSF